MRALQLKKHTVVLLHPVLSRAKWKPPPRAASSSRSAPRRRARQWPALLPDPGAEPGRYAGSVSALHARRSTAPLSSSTPPLGRGIRRRATTRRWGSSCCPFRGSGRSSSAPSSRRSPPSSSILALFLVPPCARSRWCCADASAHVRVAVARAHECYASRDAHRARVGARALRACPFFHWVHSRS